MNKLLTLIKKNFRIILRSKSSALMIILGPLILITLVGAAFNTANVYGIRVGTYSENYSPLSEAIIYELNKDNYNTQKVTSEQACITSVKNGVFHVCAIFPKKLEVSSGGNIDFYVDNTKKNIIYLITETISSQINKKSKDLSMQLTKGVVDTLDDIKLEIEDNSPLLAEVKTDNVEISNIIGLVNSDLAGMSLSHEITNIPLGALEAEMKNSNSSTTAMAAFTRVENEIENILYDIDKSQAIQTQSINKLSNIKQLSENNKFRINQIEITFTQINKNIDSVAETGVGRIVNPIKSEIKPVTSNKTHLNFIFPTLLMMILMFVSLLMASTLEMREKTSKVYFKNYITPTSEISFILSNYLTNLTIITIQTTILLGAAAYFFYEGIGNSLNLLIPALLLSVSIFLFLGIALGNLFKTEETNTITAISLGFIMVFFSSAILPVETMPTLIRKVASFNPFFISETLLNQIILFKANFKIVAGHFLKLGGYLIGAILTATIFKKIAKRRQ
jgi:ABC-2 type transport system permease protein